MSTSLSRIREQINEKVSQKNFYEAHQLCRTLSFRFKRQKQHDGALEVLYQGAMSMFKYNELKSGVDLAKSYVDYLFDNSCSSNDQIISRVSELHVHLRSVEDDSRTLLVKKCLQWAENIESKSALNGLHLHFGQNLLEESNYQSARHHLLHSQNGTVLASMLIEHHTKRGHPCEVDLFVTQAVLQLLSSSNENHSFALVTFQCYTERHPMVATKSPPFPKPLLNFTYLLLIATGRKESVEFAVLLECYGPSLKVDSTYSTYLNQIGCLFFGLPSVNQNQQPQSTGLFGNLLRTLFDDRSEHRADETDEEGFVTPPDTSHQAEDLD